MDIRKNRKRVLRNYVIIFEYLDKFIYPKLFIEQKL